MVFFLYLRITKEHPAIGVLKLQNIAESNSDSDVIQKLNQGFESLLSDITKIKRGILSGDVPITKLGAVVSQAYNEIPSEEAKQSIDEFLAREEKKERFISLSLTAVELGLTVAAFCTGGIPGLILGGMGTILGVGIAAYELERIDDLNRVGNKANAGGNELLGNPDEVRQEYVLAWANLLLGLVDAGLTIKEGISYYKIIQRVMPLLDGVPKAQKSQYLRAIVFEGGKKGEKSLEFGNFGNPRRFRNVLNALDSANDVDILKRVFDEDYLNSLGDQMAGRYRRLLDDLADGNPPRVAEYAEPLSFSDRLKVLDGTKKIKAELVEKTKNAPPEVLEALRLSERNISYGFCEITLPNGEKVIINFVSTSGKTSGRGGDLLDYTGATLDDGRTIIPDFPKRKKSKFFEASESIRANDSERKTFEYIMGQIKAKLSKDRTINFKPQDNLLQTRVHGVYEGKGFSGKITINSEMKPCDSCGDIIAE